MRSVPDLHLSTVARSCLFYGFLNHSNPCRPMWFSQAVSLVASGQSLMILMSLRLIAGNLYIWVKWPPNLAPFDAAFCSLRTHARKGLILNPSPAGLAAQNLVREPVLDSHAPLPPPSLSVDFQRPATTSMDHMYIKAKTRLRDKMASPSSPSPISFRGTFDPISNPPP